MVARVPRGVLVIVLAVVLALAALGLARTRLPVGAGRGPGGGAPGQGGAWEDGGPGEGEAWEDGGAGFAEGSLGVLDRLLERPLAVARIQGGPLAPEIEGPMAVYPAEGGSLVAVRVTGLPPYSPAESDRPPIGPYGFHIHEFGSCEVGDPRDPFQAAGGHWNPTGQPHGNHAGDLPVLFSNLGERGLAFMVVFTDEFEPSEVVGRSVIIHLHPDDFRTEPAGASGPRLACGVIEAAAR